jgi:hypothetical protein
MTPRTRTRLGYACAAVGVLLLVGIFLAVLGLGNAGTTAEDGKNAVGGAAVNQSDRTLVLCRGSAGADVAKALADAGLCSAAQQVKAQASSAGVPATVTVTSGVDPAQLRQYAKAAADSYCDDHNECAPDMAVLVPIVADYLTKHPPTRPKPTASEVQAAVSFVMNQNPAAFKGADGANGQDAPPVTDDQLAAQVAAYCADGRCQGKQGAQGVGQVSLVFSRNDSGGCEAVVTLIDPSDGSTKTTTTPAGDAACPEVPPPTTTTTTEEPPAGDGGGLLGGG